MKNLKLLSTFFLCALSPFMSAADEISKLSSGFAHSGFYGQAGLGYNRPSSKFMENSISSSGADSNGQPAFAATVGYDYVVDQWNFGANFYYTYLSSKENILPGLNGRNAQYVTFNNIWGLTFEPGYYFSQKFLGYTKLGFAQTKTGYRLRDSSQVDFGVTNGYVFGLGLKYGITDNFFIGTELFTTQFARKSNVNNTASLKLSMTQLLFNIGYKF